jgi:hypothetical protein
MKRVLLSCLLVTGLATGCGMLGGEEEETTTTTTAEPAGEPAADEPAAEPANEGGGDEGGGSVCERAQSCCEGYVNEMNQLAAGSVSVDTACAGIAAARNAPGGAADASCQQIITSFRTTLQSSNRTVPSSCQ